MRAIAAIGFAATLLAGCAHRREAEAEPTIPFECGGKELEIVYHNGGYFPRATADIRYDGHDYHLNAVPPTYGLRYVSGNDANAPITIWSVRGEEAWLTELDPGQSDERELAHCERVRS